MNVFRLLGKPIALALLLFLSQATLLAQQSEVDSLYKALNSPINDSVKVKVLRNLSFYVYKHNPDSALNLAYQGLKLAKKIQYKIGISNCYEMLGLVLTRTGNYSTALKYYIENLKIEEQLHSLEGIASVCNNIGVNYVYMEEFQSALQSFKKADSLVISNNIQDLIFSVKLNLGNVFEKLINFDSAFIYYNQAMNVAIKTNDNYAKGKAMLGIGNIYLKTNEYDLALANFTTANEYFLIEKDEDFICEANLGLAKVYLNKHNKDSVLSYSRQTLMIARKDKFLSRELETSIFLSDYFSANHQYDSAFYYLLNSNHLKDSLLGIEKLKDAQKIILEENVRQAEIVEKMLEEKESKRQQLQHILIGMLIPMLFFITALFSKIRIKVKVVKFLGIISLLFLFEYLTLVLHPIVAEITHHSPLLEILIFVAIASFLIPAHHKLEHWMIGLLSNNVSRLNTSHPNTEATVVNHDHAISQAQSAMVTTKIETTRTPSSVKSLSKNKHKHK